MLFVVAGSILVVSAPSKNVNINAPYLLERTDGGGAVTITFTMADYTAGYAAKFNAIQLQVGAPGAWTLGATASSGSFGTGSAVYAKADGGTGWKDLGGTPSPLLAGANGAHKFYVSYKVVAAELTGASGQDISATITVTYSFI